MENLSLEELQEVLNGWFEFQRWSSHRREPKQFVDELPSLAFLDVYRDFKKFLSDFEYLLYVEDENGNEVILTPDEVVSSKENFERIMDNWSLSSTANISFEEIGEPFICGEIISHDHEKHLYIELVSKVKTEDDLLVFINDVLSDFGSVTHYKGGRHEYYVIGIYTF